jgi:hypothetical protein
MEAAGIEPACDSSQGTILQGVAQAPSQPLARTLARETQFDPDLALLIEAWPTLPEAVRAGIVAMVKAASKGG